MLDRVLGVGHVNVAQYYVSFYVRLHGYVNAPDDLGPCKRVELACSTDGSWQQQYVDCMIGGLKWVSPGGGCK